ncbi:MAG: s-methyl-5-thioribose-1-phosphate isomerase, partial [Christensenellaceae bacterium]
YGTALGPLFLGKERGMNFRVFTDETRPLLQGARLSAFELCADAIDTTVICDNMAASVMSKGWVDAVLVGADRIAANGDCCNKVGTMGVAIMAKHFGIPFYVLAPTSTVDMSISSGEEIVIEQRRAEEVTDMWYEKKMAPEGVKVYNPAFDVTPAELVSAIITERGIINAPYKDSLREMMKEAD